MKVKDYRKTIKESTELHGIMDLLLRLGFVVWRSNTGGMKTSHTTKLGITKNYYVKFGKKGLPDIQGYIPSLGMWARPIFIEVKRKGGKPSPEQLEFITTARENGCFACIGTYEDVVAELKREYYL